MTDNVNEITDISNAKKKVLVKKCMDIRSSKLYNVVLQMRYGSRVNV